MEDLVETLPFEHGNCMMRYGFALARITGTDIYFVRSDVAIVDENGEIDEDSHRYTIEEGSCPTNFLDCEAFIEDGDYDPHGIFEFVQFAPFAYRDKNGGHNVNWNKVFSRLPQASQ